MENGYKKMKNGFQMLMVVKLNLFIKIKKAKGKRVSERIKFFKNKINVNNIIIILY